MSEKIQTLSCATFMLEKGTAICNDPISFGIAVSEEDPVRDRDEIHDGTLRSWSIPFSEKGGMTEEERTEITHRFRGLENTINRRPYRQLLWRFDPTTSAWGLNWRALASVVHGFVELASVGPNPRTGETKEATHSQGRFVCYSLLEDQLLEVDGADLEFLEALLEKPGTSADPLVERMVSRGYGTDKEVTERLVSIVKRYVMPLPVISRI